MLTVEFSEESDPLFIYKYLAVTLRKVQGGRVAIEIPTKENSFDWTLSKAYCWMSLREFPFNHILPAYWTSSAMLVGNIVRFQRWNLCSKSKNVKVSVWHCNQEKATTQKIHNWSKHNWLFSLITDLNQFENPDFKFQVEFFLSGQVCLACNIAVLQNSLFVRLQVLCTFMKKFRLDFLNSCWNPQT